jgi:hypothetical protein
MKNSNLLKLILIYLIFFLSFQLSAQLTISNLGNTHFDGPGNSYVLSSSPGLSNYTPDAGTNWYVYYTTENDFHFRRFIMRINNQWVIGEDSYYTAFGGGSWHSVERTDNKFSLEIDPYCTIDTVLVSGTTCLTSNNTLAGNVTYDLNNDNCATSSYKPSILLQSQGPTINYLNSANSSGNYEFYFSELGAFSTSINTPNITTILPVSLSYVNSITSTPSAITNQDFCIKSAVAGDDVDISLLPLSQARPGFNTRYKIKYTNRGANAVNGTISLNYDGTILHSPSSVTSFSSALNTFTFSYTGLLPFETKEIEVTFTVFTPPTVNGGDINTLTATNTLTGTDIDLSNNTQIINQTIINGYDPNDATILEGDYITAAQAQNDLNFRLRFQNTGNASAINIRVNTELDADLDWATFQPVSASHPYNTVITSGNQISFRFDNINLIDSTTNEPASHGYVFFKVKPKSTFAMGDIVECQADIFFDFNSAVVTNTATTQIPPPPSPSQSLVLLPNVMSLPRLSNADILTIPCPEAGMLVFDIDNLCVMLYNGMSWNCL